LNLWEDFGVGVARRAAGDSGDPLGRHASPAAHAARTAAGRRWRSQDRHGLVVVLERERSGERWEITNEIGAG